MILGLADVLGQHHGFDRFRFERAVKAAQLELAPPSPEPPPRFKKKPEQAAPTDPYRNAPVRDPDAEDTEAATALLRTAEQHHFHKRFGEARAVYHDIVDRFGNTKPAAIARQQLENLRDP